MADFVPANAPKAKHDSVGEAVDIVDSANLPHPSPWLLKNFIGQALNPRVSAGYVLSACEPCGDDNELRRSKLLRLVDDWKYIVEASKQESGCTKDESHTWKGFNSRNGLTTTFLSVSHHGVTPPSPDSDTKALIARRDGHKCCITGKEGTSRDPLIVAPILPIPSTWCYAEVGFKQTLFFSIGSNFH